MTSLDRLLIATCLHHRLNMMQIGKAFEAMIIGTLYGSLQSALGNMGYDDTVTQSPAETTHLSCVK